MPRDGRLRGSERSFGEGFAAFAFLLIGIALRFSPTSWAPLSSSEAAGAWGAWMVANGLERTQAFPFETPASPLLFSLQRGIFWFVDGGDYGARLAPLLLGSALILTPWLFRSRIGRVGAIAMAGLIAIDPALIQLSRFAGGAMLSGFFGLLALAFLLRLRDLDPFEPGAARTSRRALTGLGVMGGLLLASGSEAWSFLPVLTLFVILYRDRLSEATRLNESPSFRLAAPLLLATGAGCTGLLTHWEGMGYLSAGLSNWFTTWGTGPSDIGVVTGNPLLVASALGGFFLLFRLVFLDRTSDRRGALFLTLWSSWALFSGLARSSVDLVWLEIALLFAAAHAWDQSRHSLKDVLVPKQAYQLLGRSIDSF